MHLYTFVIALVLSNNNQYIYKRIVGKAVLVNQPLLNLYNFWYIILVCTLEFSAYKKLLISLKWDLEEFKPGNKFI